MPKFYNVVFDFEEFQPGSYNAIVVFDEDGGEKRFATDDPKADLEAAQGWIAKQDDPQVLFSSSADHFVQDNPEWRFVGLENKAGIRLEKAGPKNVLNVPGNC